MKLLVEVFLFVVVPCLFFVFAPWQDWIMVWRINTAKKSLASGKEVLATLEAAIAGIKAKIAEKPEGIVVFEALLKELTAQRDNLTLAVERFTDKLEYIEELRKVVNSKAITPEQADAVIVRLSSPEYDKLDEFLSQLNGDGKKNGNG